MKTFVEEVPREYAIKRLKLDPRNPRLKLHPGGNSEKEIIERLCRLGSQSPSQIVKHIATDRGFLHNEAPVVYIAPGTSELLVIDGNRRVAALKMILNYDLIPATRHGLKSDCEKLVGLVPERIRCWVTRNPSDAKRIVYRAHNEGSREWETLSKYSTHYDYFKSGVGIPGICELTGTDQAGIVRQINTWLLVEAMMEKINEFEIDSFGITSFERATTTYTGFASKLDIKSDQNGVYEGPLDSSQVKVIYDIYLNSAKKSGFSRDVPNNDKGKEAFLKGIVPVDFLESRKNKVPSGPSISAEAEDENASFRHNYIGVEPTNADKGHHNETQGEGTPSPEPPSSGSDGNNSKDQRSEPLPSIRQILLVQKNVGKKAFAIFKEYVDLSRPGSDYPIACAALTRAMIETTIKFHAKRLNCYEETPEQKQKSQSDLLDSIAQKLKQKIAATPTKYSADMLSAITNCCKSVPELNDVMHKDGSFAARNAVKSALNSLASAVEGLMELPSVPK